MYFVVDLYQFHAGEVGQHKQAILGQFDDDIDHKNIYDTVPDPGVIHALINADNTWKQRFVLRCVHTNKERDRGR